MWSTNVSNVSLCIKFCPSRFVTNLISHDSSEEKCEEIVTAQVFVYWAQGRRDFMLSTFRKGHKIVNSLAVEPIQNADNMESIPAIGSQLEPWNHVINITIAALILIVYHWLNANFSHSSWNQIKKCWIWISIFCCNDFHFIGFWFRHDRKPKLGIGNFVSAPTAFKVFSKANCGSFTMIYVA